MHGELFVLLVVALLLELVAYGGMAATDNARDKKPLDSGSG